MQTQPARGRPFPLPADVSQERALSVSRAATAQLLNAIRSPNEGRGERILKEVWPSDHRALSIVTRAATAPATTTTAGFAAELAVTTSTAAAFLSNLVPSAAAALFARAALQLSLDGVGTIKIPFASATPSLSPSFVVEGAPIPVRQAAFTTVTLGPVKKMSVITTLSNELAEHSVPTAEQLLRQVMTETAGRALDSAVFSAVAADAARPAGILNGVSAITATAGGGQAALIGDVKLLTAALAAAGGGGGPVMVFAAPVQAATIPLLAPGYAGLEIIPTVALAAGTIIMLDASGIVAGTSGIPRVDVAKSTLLHFDDTTPLQISSGAQGSGVLATPTRSTFQSDLFALRLSLDCSWAVRSGFVQYIAAATW